MVGALAALYRRLMGATAAAGLAALFYAIDDAHGPPVAFLANRNAMMATLFGVLAVQKATPAGRSGCPRGLNNPPASLRADRLFTSSTAPTAPAPIKTNPS